MSTATQGLKHIEPVDHGTDWWSEMLPRDIQFLERPAPQPCPWCRGRTSHHPLCIELRQSWETALLFGKHKGKRFSDVPRGYLEWLVAQDFIDANLRAGIDAFLADRAKEIER